MLLAFAFSRHLANCKRDKMHSVTEIEEKIRQRYHQPKGVEQFGIEPVPPELKTVLWHDIFAIIFGFALNPGSMLVGGMAVVSGLSFLGSGRGHHRRRIVGDHRLYDHRDRRRRLWPAGPGLDAHGLWSARRQMGAVVSANDRLDLLVRLSDRGGLAGSRRNPRPLDRDAAFAGRGQPDLRRICRRSSRSSATRR